MEFGTFYQLPSATTQSPQRRYEETLIQIQHADSLGIDIAWLAELHFFPTFSIMPSPLLVASALVQRTRHIRLGIAVNLLPLHNPLRNAEDAATLDILCNGRLEYGAGRGSIPHQRVIESMTLFAERVMPYVEWVGPASPGSFP
jgi:alkanesulfonate monooxygenase SsuD/methylene tetrahydromethanopterin reductase-like flavin-dependent oxidoreductase (luciferase family)